VFCPDSLRLSERTSASAFVSRSPTSHELTGQRVPGAVIRVLIVDDHPVVRSGLAGLLAPEQDMTVVGEAGDGSDALTLAAQLRPDVVLMDLRMPTVDGVDATLRLGQEVPEAHVLILTTYDTDSDIVRAVEAGATGYLLKDAPRGQLVDAVRRAARGETVLAPPVAARLVDRVRKRDVELTARELEVLAQVARGLSNAEIGERLYIGEATVKTHILHVFAKLGVTDRTAAVTVAMERGLLPSPNR
jgi:DNA-binding NarL/FixJ family response regulator